MSAAAVSFSSRPLTASNCWITPAEPWLWPNHNPRSFGPCHCKNTLPCHHANHVITSSRHHANHVITTSSHHDILSSRHNVITPARHLLITSSRHHANHGITSSSHHVITSSHRHATARTRCYVIRASVAYGKCCVRQARIALDSVLDGAG